MPSKQYWMPFLLIAVLATGCSDSSKKTDPPDRSGHTRPRVIAVPEEHSSIQGAVDAARAGDTVEIAAGTYRESVTIETASVTIRGSDRNEVILDGEFTRDNGMFIAADDVVVENLTVRNYTVNGVFVTGDGSATNPPGTDSAPTTRRHYRVSYVTAANNGLYGIYAFGAQDGIIEYSYASGSPDSGIYVGQCSPCRTIVRDVTTERNSIGMYLTNAGGDLYIVNSRFANNRVGASITSQTQELLAPQGGETFFGGNLVEDNQSPDSPKTAGGFGVGVAIAGGRGNTVTKNLIRNHADHGVLVTDLDAFAPSNNCISENAFSGNLIDVGIGLSGSKSFDGRTNGFGSGPNAQQPMGLVDALPCGNTASAIALPNYRSIPQPPSLDWKEIPLPAAQPSMPTPFPSERVPAKGQSTEIDLSLVITPAG